jgi:8-oxo-dGTP pyrophosphatase MutT (NUDIX family)
MQHLFPHSIISAINRGVPGERSHLKMAPLRRPISSNALRTANNVRESAVAIVLFPQGATIDCLLIVRPIYDGNHSGQVAFPGGKRDKQDRDLEETARRETLEEIGIPMSEGLLLGKLTQVYIPVSGFLVHPFLFYHSKLPVLQADEREVAEIFSFSLSELLDESSISTLSVQLPSKLLLRNIPCFQLAGKEAWGATALILNELRDLVLNMGNEGKEKE